MKNSWSAYVIVAILSALVAVAIAGTPQTLSKQATVSIPAAVTTTTAPAPDTTVEESTTTTTTSSTTSAPAPEPSTTVGTTTTTTLPDVDRASVAVVAVNGASVSGLAGRVRGELEELGYERARPTDGTTIVDETVVYFFPGFEREAGAVAVDLGLSPFSIAPVDDAPSFGELDGDQVVVYLGRDRG